MVLKSDPIVGKRQSGARGKIALHAADEEAKDPTGPLNNDRGAQRAIFLSTSPPNHPTMSLLQKCRITRYAKRQRCRKASVAATILARASFHNAFYPITTKPTRLCSASSRTRMGRNGSSNQLHPSEDDLLFELSRGALVVSA
jgi:hypothetical protein